MRINITLQEAVEIREALIEVEQVVSTLTWSSGRVYDAMIDLYTIVQMIETKYLSETVATATTLL